MSNTNSFGENLKCQIRTDSLQYASYWAEK